MSSFAQPRAEVDRLLESQGCCSRPFQFQLEADLAAALMQILSLALAAVVMAVEENLNPPIYREIVRGSQRADSHRLQTARPLHAVETRVGSAVAVQPLEEAKQQFAEALAPEDRTLGQDT